MDAYEARLAYEIDVIKRMKLSGLLPDRLGLHPLRPGAGYPGRSRSWLGGGQPGGLLPRGSPTSIPLEFGLIFERFLNPERVSLPDIDIDFCERRRGEVIEYVTRKYGRENVAQIITFGTMKARAVVRDVGPHDGASPTPTWTGSPSRSRPALDMTLDKALDENPTLKDMLARRTRRVKELVDVAKRLEGVTRHASVHAAGVVIAPRAHHRVRAPLQEPEGRDHDPVGHEGGRAGRPAEDGLPRPEHVDAARTTRSTRSGPPTGRTDRTSRRSRSTTRGRISCSARGRRSGIFQFESSGMRETRCGRPSPQRFEDLIALNALYRPGPLRGGVVDDFIKRRHGKVDDLLRAAGSSSRSCRTPMASSRIRSRSCGSPAISAGFSDGRGRSCSARRWGRRTPRSWRRSASASCHRSAVEREDRRRATAKQDLGL